MKFAKVFLSVGVFIVISVVGVVKYNLAQDTNSDAPVRIFSPSNRTTLVTGQSFTIQAKINPQNFHFEPKIVEVQLFNVSTKFSHIWTLEPISSSSSFQINQSLRLPDNVPLGNDDYYRLSVRGMSIDGTVGLGYTIAVGVVGPNSP